MATKKKAKKKAESKSKAAPKAERKGKIARQSSLPGMEDTRIKKIEELALDYVELRDERMRIGTDEVTVKTRLLAAMHAEKKTEYHRGKVHIVIKPEGEKITVRIKDEESPDKPIVLEKATKTEAVIDGQFDEVEPASEEMEEAS